MRRFALLSAPLIAVMLLVSPALAQPDAEDETNPRLFNARKISNNWNVRIGGYLATFNTEASLTPNDLSLGGLLVLESDLGLEPSSDLFRAEAVWRFAPRHKVELSVFNVERTANRTLTADIEWDGNVIEAGASVDTTFDTRFVKAGYRYSFWNNGRIDAGFSAGLSFMDLFLELDATGEYTDPGGILQQGRLVESGSILAPVPAIGIFIDYAFTKKLIFRSRAEFFKISVSGTGGSVTDAEAGIEWYFWKWLGIGAGTHRFQIAAQGTSDDSRFQANYDINGLFVYATFAWGGDKK